ncbi:glycoside hydrolase family 25 protein [Clostridiaceae bacterium OttesenSCG-928-D20]|nr:glycoside hydrolase family 25 protein [Clostridiaceae bacterium OttesenSCG-928-D20]
MKKNHFLSIIICLSLLLILISANRYVSEELATPTPSPDPFEGMIRVNESNNRSIWIPLHDELAVMNMKSYDFSSSEGVITYKGESLSVQYGIDVSEHQGEINWQKVADSGVEFAMIRVGYRGYIHGIVCEDLFFRQNIEGARAAGIKVGAYFFSQATSVAEGREEAAFALSLLEGYSLDLPLAFDWERITSGSARTDETTGAVVTDAAIAFTSAVKKAGLSPMVYFNKKLGYYEYELNRLSHVPFWVSSLTPFPDFYYEHSIWQYSFSGEVDGINTSVDLDMMFIK